MPLHQLCGNQYLCKLLSGKQEATPPYPWRTCLVTQQTTTLIQNFHHEAGPAHAQINTRSFPGQALLHITIRYETQVLQASKLQVSEIQHMENQSLLAKSRATDVLHRLARPLVNLKSPFTATCLGVGTC